MLILTRRIQEAIIINDNVSVTVLSVSGNQVRLGIDAPREVEVHREEIYHQVKAGTYDKTKKKPPITPSSHNTSSKPVITRKKVYDVKDGEIDGNK